MALGGMDKYVNGLRLFYGDARSVLDRTRGMTDTEFIEFYNNRLNTGYIVNNDMSPNGTRLGVSVREQIPFQYEVVTDDSNLPGGTFQGGNTGSGNIPGNVTQGSGGTLQPQAGSLNNLGQVVATVADKVSLAVAGVNIGAKLGLAFDRALYNRFPDFWDRYLPGMNPQYWNGIVGISPVGDFFARVLFGITGNDMTGYLSADMLAYYYQYMRDNNFWGDDSGATGKIDSYTPKNTNWNLSGSYGYPVYFGGSSVSVIDPVTQEVTTYSVSGSGRIYTVIFSLDNGTRYQTPITVSDAPITATSGYRGAASSYNIDGHTYYYIGGGGSSAATRFLPPFSSPATNVYTLDVVKLAFNGEVTPVGNRQEGVDDLPQATPYPPTNITGSTPQEVKQQLQQQYPDLFTDAITEKTVQDDGSVTETTYVPIPWVTPSLDEEQATTGDGTQTDTQITPEIADQIMPTTQQDEPAQPPTTGEGDAPVPAIPSGSASSLWAVYNPSQGELNSFGAWLWNSNFVEQLKKLFADPMQAIIGVHKVFVTPSTGGSQTIKCGYLDSGVSASVVTNQYTTIDCGSASLREYFGNVFDYDPFTKVSIFLPFIGIVPLNTADVMRSTVSVKYKVDVITGACLAEVSVSRDGGGGILYTYGGSAIVTYPVSSGSYIGAVQAALSTALGIGSAIATGGASLGASAGMVLGGLSHAKTQVQHSGQFSGCSGAMGGKKPYLIISRPQTRTPQRVAEYEGIPTNSIHQLINCNGFTKVKDVHIMSKTAYDNEIQEIESLLKTGVIF